MSGIYGLRGRRKSRVFFLRFVSLLLCTILILATPGALMIASAEPDDLPEADAPDIYLSAVVKDSKVEATIQNRATPPGTIKGYCVLAVYDGSGKLAFTKFEDVDFDASVKVTFDADISAYLFDESFTMKVFLWDLDYVPLTQAANVSVAGADSRQKYNFNMGWKFTLAEPNGPAREDPPNNHTYLFAGQNPELPEFNDAGWDDVSLPHSPNDADAFKWYERGAGTTANTNTITIRDTDGAVVANNYNNQQGQREMYTGRMWYRKHFTMPDSSAGKKVFIEFESARQSAEVWLNGQKLVGKYENGFIPFGYDLTPLLNAPGEDNVIAILVDNTFPYRTTEFGTWTSSNKDSFVLPWHDSHWHPTYGGLYRNLYLYVTDQLHVTLPLYSFLKTQGTYVYTENETEGLTSTGVSVEAEIFNEYSETKTFTYEAVIYDMEGNPVESGSSTLTLEAGKKTSDFNDGGNIYGGRAVIKLKIDDPMLWSPDYPYLYSVATNIILDGKLVDSASTLLGVRTWKFTGDKGFEINGRYTKLKGWGQKSTNEWPGLASALPDWLQEFTLQQMKDAGANYIRWGHSSGGPSQVELSDRLGLITCQPGVEAEGTLDYGYSDRTMKVRLAAWQDMLIYYRNSPSILLWEYGNQPVNNTTDYLTGTTNYNIQTMYNMILKWDPRGNRERTSRITSGNDTAYMTVIEGTQGSSSRPNNTWPVVESEYDRSEAPRRAWDRYTPGYENYQSVGLADYLHWTIDRLVAESVSTWNAMVPEWHSGGANWIFSDSTSHSRTFSEMARPSGEVDGVRIEKETYYALQTMWSKAPSARVIGHWNYPVGTVKPVQVVANTARVNLLINGVQVATSTTPSSRYLFTFNNITWAEGEITAVGCDGLGREVVRHSIYTHGNPVALKLTTHEPEGGLTAGGEVLLVDVEAVDAFGRRCSTYEGMLEFDISQFVTSGTGIWQGGYNSGFEQSIMKTQIYLEAGVQRVAIRTTDKPGPITLGVKMVAVGPAQPTTVLTPLNTKLVYGDQPWSMASVTVNSKAVNNKNGLCPTMPAVKGFDFTGAIYLGYGGEGDLPPGEDQYPYDAMLIKSMLYTGATGITGSPYRAYVANPSAKEAFAYSDNGKPGADSAARKLLKFAGLPSYIVNGEYICAPNDDTDSVAGDLIQFTAGRDMMVYIAHDDRIVTKPNWLKSQNLVGDPGDERGFTPTGDSIKIGAFDYSLYSLYMKKGETINISSNKEVPTEQGNMFVLFAKELRILDEFLNEDFETQPLDTVPEGWFIHCAPERSIKVETFSRGGNANNKAVHLTDFVNGNYAVAARKFEALLSGKYSVKFSFYERNTGTRQQYQRIILSEGAPSTDAGNSGGFVIEAYINAGRFMYRTTPGNGSNNIGPTLSVNTWYDAELVIDMNTKTYDVYINGAKANTTALPFTSPAAGRKIDHIIFGTQSGSTNSDMYYDNISITPLSDVEISPIQNQTIETGEDYKVQLPLEFSPYNAILTVSGNTDPTVASAQIISGLPTLEIIGLTAGYTDITITAANTAGNTATTTFRVTVTGAQAPQVTMPPNVADLMVGYTRNVSVTYSPVNSTVISAVSANNDVALVEVISQSGGTAILRITGVSPGTSQINVTATRPGLPVASGSFNVGVIPASAGSVKLLEIDFNDLPTGAFSISGSPVPNPALPELTAIINNTSATATIVDRGNGDKYFTLHSPSADTKAMFGFEPVNSGTVIFEFKWMPDPSANSASISIVGGPGAGGAGSDAAFTIIKENATTISFRTGGTANTPNNVITNWSAGRWIDVKVEMNVGAQTYKLWVDGTQRLYQGSENIPFRYPMPSANPNIWGIAVGKANNANATVCIDDIKVTLPAPSLLSVGFNELAVTENFDISSLPNPLLPQLTGILAPTGARLVVREKTGSSPADRYIGLTGTNGNDSKALLTFPEITSGKARIEFKVMFDPTSGNNSGSIAISGGTGPGGGQADNAFIIMKTSNTEVSHRSGDDPTGNKVISGINPSAANTWIDVAVELDLESLPNKTYKLWIGGVLATHPTVAPDGVFRFRSNVPSLWGIVIGKGSNGTSLTCIDDVKVTIL